MAVRTHFPGCQVRCVDYVDITTDAGPDQFFHLEFRAEDGLVWYWIDGSYGLRHDTIIEALERHRQMEARKCMTFEQAVERWPHLNWPHLARYWGFNYVTQGV